LFKAADSHFQDNLTSLGLMLVVFVANKIVCHAMGTYIHGKLLLVRVLNRWIIALDPFIVDELCYREYTWSVSAAFT
jgi:hypothetical protein